MSDLRQDLKAEFEDPEYRFAYAESFLNTKLAAQIKILRVSYKRLNNIIIKKKSEINH